MAKDPDRYFGTYGFVLVFRGFLGFGSSCSTGVRGTAPACFRPFLPCTNGNDCHKKMSLLNITFRCIKKKKVRAETNVCTRARKVTWHGYTLFFTMPRQSILELFSYPLSNSFKNHRLTRMMEWCWILGHGFSGLSIVKTKTVL